MKGTRKHYEPIKQLPAKARSVANYAKDVNQSVANIYKLHSKGIIKIVDFEGYNFVITN